jgi:hypothetical protein
MVGTIGSIGNGAGLRGKPVLTTVGVYVIASLSGALLIIGIPSGLASATLELLTVGHPWTHAILAWVAVAILTPLSLRDFGVPNIPLPTRHRQVPMAWKYLPRYWSPFVFGFALGTGFATTIYLASFYAFILVSILTGSFTIPLAGAAMFGLARALPVVLAVSIAPIVGSDSLIDAFGRFERTVRILSGSAILAVAAVLVIRFAAANGA